MNRAEAPLNNVEMVRKLYECFRVRDNDTPFDYYADDIVWDARAVGIPGLEHVYTGHDGVREFWRQWLEAWDLIEFEMDDPIELDDGRVKVRVRQRNRGHGTGIWIDQDPYDHYWTIKGGKIVRLEFAWADQNG